MPNRSAFTLIEVLVTVMIISIVIGALMQLFATNSHTFTSVHQKIIETNRASLLLGSIVYGYENKSIDLAELVKDFDIDDDLRRALKNEKVEVIYTEMNNIDFGEMAESLATDKAEEQDNDEEEVIKETGEATNAIEIGKTTLKINGESSSFLRVKLQ